MTVPEIIFRLDLGRKLTAEEHDQNLRRLRDFCNALAALSDQGLQAKFIVLTANAALPNAIALDELADGYLYISGGNPSTKNSISINDLSYSETDIGAGAEKTIDWRNGVNFYKYMDDNCVVSFSNVIDAKEIRLVVKQNTSAAKTLSFDPTLAIKWYGGVEPTLTTRLGAYAVYHFYKTPNGNAILGQIANDKFST